ncbi:hypothetical protein Scep_028099 [Stephania cephalantha]|uniref:Uncharacterized protein n=1 Tax=Stephania cephalantha TaxID=152367 RepID=A0AAP0ECH0_9MAGN
MHDCSWVVFGFVYLLVCVLGFSVSGLVCLRWQIGTTMVQEEQNQRCSTSSSGGCGGVNGGRCAKSSKKIKQTKIPQRGLGVEKLEKIRLEEQRRNETATMPVVLPLHDHPCRRHHLHQQQQQQQNSSSMSVSHLDLFSPSIPLPQTNSSAHYLPSNVINTTFGNASSESIFAWPGHVMADGYGCVPSTWNAQELTNEFTIWVNSMNSHKDLKPNWPCPTSVPRKQQHQQVSTLMNVCATSISSSSGLNLQMEPPSNQSCYSNYYSPPIWPEEEKVGIEDPLTTHGSSVRDRRLYSFFPLKTSQIGHGISNERSDEAENDVDLTLKL